MVQSVAGTAPPSGAKSDELRSARALGAERDAIRFGGIRTKTLGVVAVPMAFLLLLSGVVVAQSVNDTRRAGQIVQFAQVSGKLTAFVTALQVERGGTLAYLRNRAASGAKSMRAQRGVTNTALANLRPALSESSSASLSPALGRAVVAAATAHGRLPAMRAGVDDSTSSPALVKVSYRAVIAADLALPDLLADAVSDSELADSLRAYGASSYLLESAAQERDAIAVASAAGRFTADQYVTLAGSIATQNSLLAALGELGTPLAKKQLNAAAAGPAASAFLRYRQLALASGNTRPLGFGTAAFSAAANDRLVALRKMESSYAASVSEVAGGLRTAALTRALLVVGLVVLGLAFPLMHALVLSRRIVRPLRQLTDSAEQIRAELPRMVERMQQPGQQPDITIEPIQVGGRDEVGRLADAFNTVNAVTVQVAIEQAALRGSIAEMFVNVARRNQALLGRQLVFLDELEAGEEDPDALKNLFHLDHLAAQMRRNAESLLILAGIDATRRLREPMVMSDVIRTAVGEIEAFHRVDLRLDVDPQVTGLRALSVAHLLAELLDNATHFSDPQSRVSVSASSGADGVILDIYDEGLGFTPQELVDANHRLASPSATEIAVAQRLGFYVVGRIAKRLNILVELKARAAGGTVVVVTLPAALFVDGSIPVPATPREEPATLPAFAASKPAPASLPQPAIRKPVTGARQRLSPVVAPKATPPATVVDSPITESTPPATDEPKPLPVSGARHWRSRVHAMKKEKKKKSSRSDAPTPSGERAIEPAVSPAPPAAGELTPPAAVEAAPVPGTRRQRRKAEAAKVIARKGSTPVPSPAPTPVATRRMEMPIAMQDILPGRQLRRMAELPAVPAASVPDAAPVAPAVPITAPAPIPEPRAAYPEAAPAAVPAIVGLTATEPAAGAPPAVSISSPQPVRSSRSNDAARSALAELSQLSTSMYAPVFGDDSEGSAASAAALSRRTAKPAVEPEPRSESLPLVTPRSADQVRHQLSGFRAGVERGRDATPEPETDQGNEEPS